MKLTLPCIATLCVVLISDIAFAAGPKTQVRKPIQIEHLNLDYKDKVGKGDVEFMSYHVENMSFSHAKLRADLEMTGPTLTLTDGVTHFSIHHLLDFVNRFDSIHLEDLGFYFENSMFHELLNKGYVGISGHHYLLTLLKAECGLSDHDVDIGDDTLQFIIQICMERGNLSLAEMTFPDNSPFTSILENIVGGVDSEKVKLKIDRIQDFSVKFDDHDFEILSTVKTMIQWKVAMKGRLEFEADHARFRIEVKEATAGILGVKHLIFNAIKKMNDPNVTVEDSNIYVLYKPIKPQPEK